MTPDPTPAGSGARRRCTRRARRGVAALGPVVALAALSLSACGAPVDGTSIATLRTLAKRVAGGGAECPLPVDVAAALRPFHYTGVVSPDQGNPAHAAEGFVPDDRDSGERRAQLPDASDSTSDPDAVRVVCRFLFGAQRLTLVVAGTTHGAPLGGAVNEVSSLARVSRAQAAAFVSSMDDAPSGQVRPVPQSTVAAAVNLATTDDGRLTALVVVEPPAAEVAPAARAGVVVSDADALRTLTARLARDLVD